MSIRIPSRIKRAAKVLFAPLPAAPQAEDPLRESLLHQIKAAPSSGIAHQRLADYYAKQNAFVRAIAEYRTALAFERSSVALRSLADAYRSGGYSAFLEGTEAAQLTPEVASKVIPRSAGTGPSHETALRSLDSQLYQRIGATAARIKELYGDKPVRILDVGGGDGALCLFLPDAEYVLAEPATNGLSGDVVLPDRSFDVVALCHVLEHIPTDARDNFLSKLCLKARGHLLIVGPLAVSSFDGLGDRLAYEITKASWAAEHIACVLPTMDSIKAFARREGFPVTITPNGDAAAVFWMVFASYFASKSGESAALARVTEFFNTHLSERMTNPVQPNDFIVELSLAADRVKRG
jgi:hypothetical protein